MKTSPRSHCWVWVALSSLQDLKRVSVPTRQVRSPHPTTQPPSMDGFPTRDIALTMPNAAWPSAKPNQATGSTQRAPALLTAHYRGLKAQPLTSCKQMGMKSIPGRSSVGVRLPHTLTSTALKKSIRNLYEALEIGALQAHTSHLLPFSSAFPSNPSPLT